MSDLLNNV